MNHKDYNCSNIVQEKELNLENSKYRNYCNCEYGHAECSECPTKSIPCTPEKINLPCFDGKGKPNYGWKNEKLCSGMTKKQLEGPLNGVPAVYNPYLNTETLPYYKKDSKCNSPNCQFHKSGPQMTMIKDLDSITTPDNSNYQVRHLESIGAIGSWVPTTFDIIKDKMNPTPTHNSSYISGGYNGKDADNDIYRTLDKPAIRLRLDLKKSDKHSLPFQYKNYEEINKLGYGSITYHPKTSKCEGDDCNQWDVTGPRKITPIIPQKHHTSVMPVQYSNYKNNERTESVQLPVDTSCCNTDVIIDNKCRGKCENQYMTEEKEDYSCGGDEFPCLYYGQVNIDRDRHINDSMKDIYKYMERTWY